MQRSGPGRPLCSYDVNKFERFRLVHGVGGFGAAHPESVEYGAVNSMFVGCSACSMTRCTLYRRDANVSWTT